MAKKGLKPTRVSEKRQKAAQDDEFPLGEVNDLHHPPHHCHAIGGQREDGADKDTIDEQLQRENRCRE